MELKVKIWLTGDAEHGILGEGRYRLLREIGQEGSLQKAARKLGLSYRKAWGDVRAMEEQLGFKLVERRRGGSWGGASTLTDRTVKLLDAFAVIKTNLDQHARHMFIQELKPLLNEAG